MVHIIIYPCEFTPFALNIIFLQLLHQNIQQFTAACCHLQEYIRSTLAVTKMTKFQMQLYSCGCKVSQFFLSFPPPVNHSITEDVGGNLGGQTGLKKIKTGLKGQTQCSLRLFGPDVCECECTKPSKASVLSPGQINHDVTDIIHDFHNGWQCMGLVIT